VREPQKVKEAEEEAEEEAEAFEEEAGLSPAFISLESRRVYSFALKKNPHRIGDFPFLG